MPSVTALAAGRAFLGAMEGVTTAEDDAKCWAAAQRSVVVVVLVRWAGLECGEEREVDARY
jgi:hypothetical protein